MKPQSINRTALGLAAGILSAASMAAHACTCQLPEEGQIIQLLNELEAENEVAFDKWARIVTDKAYYLDPPPTPEEIDENCIEPHCFTVRGAVLLEETQNRGSASKIGVAQVKVIDNAVGQMRRHQSQAAVAESDAEMRRRTYESTPPGACQRAQTDREVGRSLPRVAAAGSSMRGRAADKSRGLVNPVTERKRILELADRKRVPEMILSDAGTMSPEQTEDFLDYVRLIMPTPPRDPKLLPEGPNDDGARDAYRAEAEKTFSLRGLVERITLREAELSTPSIVLTEEQQRIWEGITMARQTPEHLARTEGTDPSQFPDHWAALNFEIQPNGDRLISERDYMRVEVFRRYINPHYQSDPVYGLSVKSTKEMLLKEMIEVSSLRNRMVYEIQNSVGHILSLRALMGYAALNGRRKEELDTLFIEATAN